MSVRFGVIGAGRPRYRRPRWLVAGIAPKP